MMVLLSFKAFPSPVPEEAGSRQKTIIFIKGRDFLWKKWNTPKKPRIGIYTMGLKAYWNQFPGLRERLLHYGQFIAEK